MCFCIHCHLAVFSPVMTWGGEKSQSVIEAEKEDRERNRKSWSERYDEDIDKGKVTASLVCLEPTLKLWELMHEISCDSMS